MPLYDFYILDEQGNRTGEIVERLAPVGTSELVAADGTRAVRKEVNLIARTAGRWGDSHKRWDKDLGAMVGSQRDIDRICKEKGLVDTSDISDYRDRALKRVEDQNEAKRYFDDQNDKWLAACTRQGVPATSDGSMESDMRFADGWTKAWDEVLPPVPAVMDKANEMAEKIK